ncbi:TonB-linked SusC/RagA family outer membrane protein [Mangrovibacterium marinum]|uniref:TonB-linked SusC/RagA family outer membrane protein n=1 Tax=Mangrovibacterium marinum TaxID=1639118 RepID=A0A2T5C1D9_9BACT|nr:SusC/RagA family TonB-linked outer membrane protein [Mangrovibacterium marinum]PTN08411.1 TonB-linked SusC/RagA family outer membrane protein [Mangrovibacterium marinum]
MKKIALLLAIFAIGLQSLWAQTREITGTVTSADDGSTIPGVSVSVKGTTLGTITDLDGKYVIKVSQDAKTLVFSFVGMQTTEKAISGNVIDAQLESDVVGINEVVVTAMGIKRSEKTLGYAATSVGGEELAEKRTADIMSSLAGKVAGVQIASTSSDPGSSKSVIIRGISSLGGSNQPLYVIDGVPMNNSSVSSSDGLNSGYDFGNGASAVNPDDVENMTILKGAAATALYGSRAANGVVMITTKQGKKGKGIGIEYNGGLQWSSVLRLPQMQNEFGMGWYGEHTQLENGSWGPKFDGSTELWGNVYNNSQKLKPYVALEDNIKDFFDVGFRQNHSLSFNGASDNSTYFVSGSYIDDNGIIPTDADSYKKYTFSVNGSHTSGALTFTTALNYAYQENSFATTGQGLSVYNSIMQTPRDISIIGLANLDDPFNMPGYYYTPYGVTNPYYILENYENVYNSERLYGKFQLDYDFLKYFKFTYRFGLDTSTGQRNTGEPNLYALYYEGTANGSPLGTNSPFTGETGSVSEQTIRRREINQDIMVTFNKQLEDFSLNAIVGFNGNERKYSSLYSAITDLTIPTWYNLSNTSKSPTTSTDESLRRLMGAYGQFEGGWKDLLFVTLTARNDWSSTLPEGNRSFFYYGATGSFIFSELLGDNSKNTIDFGKIRLAWGKTGNDADPYMVNPVYAQSGAYGYWGTGTFSFPFNSAGYNAYTVGNVLGSSSLSPEMTTEFEVGLNLAFLKNRINIDAAFYNRLTDKQIYSLDMDYASGFTAQNTNLGEVRNRGIELNVNVTPVKTRDFSWDLSWRYSKNWNKVLSLPEGLGGEALIYGFTGGTGMYAIVGEPIGVYKAEVPQYTADGQVVVNAATGLPVAESDMQIVGSMNYKYQTGFTTTFRYKGVSLSADLDIRQGGLMYSRTKSISYFTGNAIQTAYNDRNPFIVPNSVNAVTDASGSVSYVENTTPLDATNIYNYFDGGPELGSSFLIDKSYVKLRSVVLSWSLPKKWLAKTPVQGIDLSAYGNNLFLWTPASNTFVDPETSSFGNDLQGNFGEYSANPSSRNFGFNAKFKF